MGNQSQVQKRFDRYIRVGAFVTIGIVILITNVLRFYGLEESPPGFHVDELSGAVSVQCLSTEGIDALDNPYPLFADLNYGSPKPPTYIYPAVLWTKMFGFSMASFRSISGFVTVLTLIGLFMLARVLFTARAALWVLLSASISPLVFHVSRLALEACFFPCFMVWSVYFFIRSNKLYDAILAGMLLSFAMYSYPPARLHIPLLICPLVFLKWRMAELRWKFIIVCLAALALVDIPLVLGSLSGEYMGRFHLIGIFSDDYLAKIGKTKSITDMGSIFVTNYFKHLNGAFLFTNGDKNLVYASGRFGLLSWLDALAFGFAVFYLFHYVLERCKGRGKALQQSQAVIIFLFLGICTAIVPAALTWHDIPHSLRILGMWPFVSLLSGYMLHKASQQFRTAEVISILLAVIFSVVFLRHYYFIYPQQSYWMFNTFTKQQVLEAKTKDDWLKFMVRYRHQNFHFRYYLMNYLEGQTCGSTQKLWRELHKIK